MSVRYLPHPQKQDWLSPTGDSRSWWACGLLSTINVVNVLHAGHISKDTVKRAFMQRASITQYQVEGIELDVIVKVLNEFNISTKLISVPQIKIVSFLKHTTFPLIALPPKHAFVIHEYNVSTKGTLIMEPDHIDTDYETVSLAYLDEWWLNDSNHFEVLTLEISCHE